MISTTARRLSLRGYTRSAMFRLSRFTHLPSQTLLQITIFHSYRAAKLLKKGRKPESAAHYRFEASILPLFAFELELIDFGKIISRYDRFEFGWFGWKANFVILATIGLVLVLTRKTKRKFQVVLDSEIIPCFVKTQDRSE